MAGTPWPLPVRRPCRTGRSPWRRRGCIDSEDQIMVSDRRNGKRGRPQKFGRPSQFVALTIPNDVLQWLRTIHSDPGWAIVSLHERLRSNTAPKTPAAMGDAELVQLTARQALIVVNPSTFRRVKGISILPMAHGRAFLALQNGQGVADLELAILDRLEDEAVSGLEREALIRVREQLKEWRSSGSWRVTSRSIILVERRRGKQHASLRNRG